MRYVGNEDAAPVDESAFEAELPKGVGPRLSKFILVTGVLSLLFVPVFKSITHLPPYMGMMVSLGVMWVLTEIIYDRKRGIEESIKCRVSKVLKHIDMPTILFFLGILMSVAALQSAGVLTDAIYHRDTGATCVIWGDYFFYETLLRLLGGDKCFW